VDPLESIQFLLLRQSISPYINQSSVRIMSRCTPVKASNDIWIATSMIEVTPKDLRVKVAQARRGFSIGLKPDLVLEGSGGTYFLKDGNRSKVGVFKPADEEPYAENNPRGYLRQPSENMTLRAGIVPGQSCVRELAAFLLDHDSFSGVPMTTLVEARHPAFNTNGARLNVSQGGAAMGSHSIVTSSSFVSSPKSKLGSFQEFVKHECTIDDFSPSKISREEVHKIAILDIRIMNADRNAANLLVRRKADDSLELIPIDHGYCLRSICDVSWMDWCWLDWPQIKEPLCDSHKDYIQKIDIEADARLLRERLNLCQEAVDYFRASSTLLKAGVAAGLTLYDIAILCCRNDNLAEEPSMMERLFEMASELAHVAVENDRWHHSTASRALVEQLVPHKYPYLQLVNNVQARRFSRSISSVEMSTLPSHPSDHSLNREENLELLAALSDSDSSSEVVEDCSEWAAELIADLTELKISPQARPNRSLSVGSDDSCDGNVEGSGKGFWVVAPGSAQTNKSDLDSVQWTPKFSPRMHPISVEIEHLDLDLPYSVKDMTNCKSIACDVKTPTVSFASNSRFIPPATVNVATYKSVGLTKTNDSFDLHRSEGFMIRSKSYSSLPAASNARRIGQSFIPGSTLKTSPYEGSAEYEIYRTYFHKFIDLVIVRETMNALHHSKQAS
jgi:Phosphatidylinositol 3- and 4-kinase